MRLLFLLHDALVWVKMPSVNQVMNGQADEAGIFGFFTQR